ncbi:hypothetical protein [Actinacidiphila glaucinigra]|uniref:hypothetical protein n=1 Tax=Actinacidiphila glaucinigra TaxID=235986 RepID=UPI0035DB9C00
MSNTHPSRAADLPAADPARAGGRGTRPDGTPSGGHEAGAVWLVGLRHRAGSGVLVHHYYVVAGTIAGVDALHRARWWAAQPAECLLRGDAAVDGTWAEVRRLIRDTLGRFRLAARTG